MADFVFNIAKGRVAEFYNRVDTNDPANSALVIVVAFVADTMYVGYFRMGFVRHLTSTIATTLPSFTMSKSQAMSRGVSTAVDAVRRSRCAIASRCLSLSPVDS